MRTATHRSSKNPKQVKHLLVGLITGLLVSIIFLLSLFFSWSKPFPIRKVEIAGNHQHISKLVLSDVMSAELSEGFFGLSVSALKEDLCYLPWVKDAIVRRVWPDKLKVTIFEHQPLAIWNDRAVLTMDGALIMPDDVSLLLSLPKFYGPEGKQEQILNLWQTMEKQLSPIDLKIVKLDLAARGSLKLSLSNGIEVNLGTQETNTRLQRFVRVYDKLLYKQDKKIAYVDLRYTSGLAVGWKEGPS